MAGDLCLDELIISLNEGLTGRTGVAKEEDVLGFIGLHRLCIFLQLKCRSCIET